MQTNSWAARGIALGLAFLVTGCEHSFTYTVWKTGEFRHFREPATNASVAVFYEPQRNDFLVAYDSVLDGGDDPRRLYYFLGENEQRIVERKKPNFVPTNGPVLIVVPVNGATNLPAAIFQNELTVYTTQGSIGPYPLPAYEETSGTVVRVLLTPL